MEREFFYIEDKEEWSPRIINQIDKEEHNDLFDFNSEANLYTTEEKDKKDCSEQSNILAPYNSTISASDGIGTTDADKPKFLIANMPIVN